MKSTEAKGNEMPDHEFVAPLEFVRDQYGFWSWALYDGETMIASCRGFETRHEAMEGFRRLDHLPVETKISEAVYTNHRGGQIELVS
jgi:hypothetical protein